MLQGAIGEYAIGELSGEGSPQLPASPITLRYSTHSFATAADDTPPHTDIKGRITSGFSFRREISGGNAGRFGGLIAATPSSELVLANGDRALDSLLTGDVDGRPVAFKVGAVTTAANGSRTYPRYDSLQLALTATGGSFGADQDTIRLRLRDAGLRLQTEIQTQVYQGTGGREGSLGLADRSKPLAYGNCFNVPCQILDEALLTYQVATTSLTSLAIYDSGIEIPLYTTHPTYSAMVTAEGPPPGYASICLAEGYFRLSITPVGQVTADIDTGHESTVEIIDQILEDAGVDASERSITGISDASQDLTGFFQPAGSNASVEEVITQLAEAAGAAFGADRSGIYRLVWLDSSRLSGAPIFTFDDVTEIDRLPLPYGVPWRGWVIGARRNWTVQSNTDLALGVTEDRRTFLELEFRESRTADPVVAARHKSSRETDLIPTFYSTYIAAQRFGNRMAAWYAHGRAMYQATVKTALCQVEVGDIVSISSPLWGLDGGWQGMVVAVTDDLGTSETELTLFG